MLSALEQKLTNQVQRLIADRDEGLKECLARIEVLEADRDRLLVILRTVLPELSPLLPAGSRATSETLSSVSTTGSSSRSSRSP